MSGWSVQDKSYVIGLAYLPGGTRDTWGNETAGLHPCKDRSVRHLPFAKEHTWAPICHCSIGPGAFVLTAVSVDLLALSANRVWTSSCDAESDERRICNLRDQSGHHQRATILTSNRIGIVQEGQC
jgi:hypothetical protein